MRNHYLLILGISLSFSACENSKSVPASAEQPAETHFRIAFGSCGHQDKPQPMLDVATALAPDCFVFLGDNIYGDSYELDSLSAKYRRLASKPEFQRLKAATPLYATWDDHDYGWNDAGRHFKLKAESKQLFMDFWEVPRSSDRYDHPGIYGVEYLQKGGKTVQLILLDNRTFRDELIHRAKSDTTHKNDYVPNNDPDSTFLGQAQWDWLENQLTQPADARVIASSNQFGHSYNGWESWTNVPHERQKMIDLIQKTKANGVIFISGDVHWGEISRLEVENNYPLYDVTSSGITETWYLIEPNDNRVGKAIDQNNIGVIDFRFGPDGDQAELALIDSTSQRIVRTEVDLAQLK